MTQPTEMELRVAKALWDAREKEFPKFTQMSFEKGTEIARSVTLAHARAAIQAMLTPTEEMLSAGHSVESKGYDTDFRQPGDVWQAMTNAASPQEQV